jgi:hypothetical protein
LRKDIQCGIYPRRHPGIGSAMSISAKYRRSQSR